MASSQTSGQGHKAHAAPAKATKAKDVRGPPPRYEDIGRYRRTHQATRRRNDLYERGSGPLASYAVETSRQELDRSLVQETKTRETTSQPNEGARITGTHGNGRHKETAKTCGHAADGKRRGTSTRGFVSTTRHGRPRDEGAVKDRRFDSTVATTTAIAHRRPPPTYEESWKQSKIYATATGSLGIQFSSTYELIPSSAHSIKAGRVYLARDGRAGSIGNDKKSRSFRKDNKTHGVVSESEDVIDARRKAKGRKGGADSARAVNRAVKGGESEKLKRTQKSGRSVDSTSASVMDGASGEKANVFSIATYSPSFRSSASHQGIVRGNPHLVRIEPQRHFDFTDTIKGRLVAEADAAAAARDHEGRLAHHETASEEDGTVSSTQAVYDFEPVLRREGSDGYPCCRPSNLQTGTPDATPKATSEDDDGTVYDTVYSTEAVHDFEAFVMSEVPKGASPVFCDGANRDFRLFVEMLGCTASSPSFEEETAV